MNDQMTLRQILALIPSEIATRKKGKEWLETEKEIASCVTQDLKLQVYKCGYVLAEQLGHWTVFSIGECGAYEYEANGEIHPEDQFQSSFEAEYFMDLPWTVRATLMALDRFESNNDTAYSRQISKHPWCIGDYEWLAGVFPSAEYEALSKIRMEAIMHVLTDKQREAIELWLAGYNQTEIATRLGIDRSSLSDRLIGAYKKIERLYI